MNEPNISYIVQKWESEAKVKWKELRKYNGHFISAWSPQFTMSVDEHKRRCVRKKMMEWTINWFDKNGVKVECVADENCCDSFGIIKKS